MYMNHILTVDSSPLFS